MNVKIITSLLLLATPHLYFQGKHAKANAGDTSTIEEGEMDPSLGTLDRKAQKAKDALNAAGNVLHNPDAIDEVKEELYKGGKGRVLFFFIIFLVNVCLGKIFIGVLSFSMYHIILDSQYEYIFQFATFIF